MVEYGRTCSIVSRTTTEPQGHLQPRQSLRNGRQKSISPQGRGFQKWKQAQEPVLNEFATSNTLAWKARVPEERLVFHCRTTSASATPCISRRMCCPTHSARPIMVQCTKHFCTGKITNPGRIGTGTASDTSILEHGTRFEEETTPCRTLKVNLILDPTMP